MYSTMSTDWSCEQNCNDFIDVANIDNNYSMTVLIFFLDAIIMWYNITDSFIVIL